MTINDNQMTKFFRAKISIGKDTDIQLKYYAFLLVANNVFCKSETLVIGPTPPGTGVM